MDIERLRFAYRELARVAPDLATHERADIEAAEAAWSEQLGGLRDLPRPPSG